MPAEPRLQLLYFHSIREITGRASETWPLNRACSTVSRLLDQLETKYPPLRDHRDSVQVAVNETFARPGARLNAGDTVALLPPVSGG